jgi:hypothetical protein
MISELPPEKELAKQEYADVSSNLRHYGNMQFAQLTIFFVVTAGLFWNVASGGEKLNGVVLAVLKTSGILLSMLFLLMSRRVSDYWNKRVTRAKQLEDILGYHQYRRPPKKRLFNNRVAVALVYWTVAFMWLATLIWPITAQRRDGARSVKGPADYSQAVQP